MPKENRNIVIAYDFDGTLAKGNIQENSFIPELGLTKEKFWEEVKALAKKEDIDEILAYMFLLIKKARDRDVSVTRENLRKHGENVRYFRGVEEYFGRIDRFAKSRKLALSHVIISSGTQEMIKQTSIAGHFQHIFASKFIYDVNNVAVWPGLAINYTTKTQFLFRINKGIYNAWDNSRINEYVPEADGPNPFRNMIYLGDGLTDVPAMKMVKEQGGWAIGVYDPDDSKEDKEKVSGLLKDNRVNYIVPADYSKDSELDTLIRSILDQIASRESIARFSELGGH